jgi:hypothetical protein
MIGSLFSDDEKLGGAGCDLKNAATAEVDGARAREIVRGYFSRGLEGICDERFLKQRYRDFLNRDDPVYATLLVNMNDRQLANTFVSYWTIGQTLAVKSRTWLEDAVYEIIRSQVTKFGKGVSNAYTQTMLSNGYLLNQKLIADIGETETEHLRRNSPWQVPIKRKALQEAALIVDEQERGVVDRSNAHKPFQARVFTDEQNKDERAKDLAYLKRVESAIAGLESEIQKIQCSLLVVEPASGGNKPTVNAYRFINPKTFSTHAKRKEERINMLRLHAYLCQEKLFREPHTIKVYVAELLPRPTSSFVSHDHYPDYFSTETYLTSERFWERLGVPFSAVKAAIADVAVEFREKLISGFRDLLPTDAKPKFDKKDSK